MAEAEEAAGAPEGEPVFDTGAAGIAVALDEARADPSLRGDVAAFLAAQRELIELQKHHLRGQFGQLRLRTFGDLVKVALQTLSLAAVLGVVAILGLLVHDAMDARGMVVTGFSVPQSLAARGMTGEVLATDLASRISAVARTTNQYSMTKSVDASTLPTDTVKLDVPATGISLSEVARFLRQRLGHETRISGDVTVPDDGGAAVTVHVAGFDPIVVRGKADDLDALMQTAAEKAFSAVDPDNFIVYLGSLGRADEAYAASEALARTARSNYMLATAYSLWAESDGDRRRALDRVQVAIHLRPQMMFTWMEALSSSENLGHDEQMLTYARRLKLSRIEDQPPRDRAGFDSVMAIGDVHIDRATANYARLAHDSEREGRRLVDRFAVAALAQGAQHDGAGYARTFALARSAAETPARDLLQAQWAATTAAGDWPAALPVAHALLTLDDDALAKGLQLQGRDLVYGQQAVLDRPLVALAEARTGRVADAQAAVATTPLDCYLCLRVRAEVAEAAGDRAGADRWFAEAVRQGPSLPLAHLEWAQAKLGRGDFAGAAAEAVKARDIAPHLADAWEVWGEALLAAGDTAGAVAKFEAAAQRAPNWGRLHLKWGQALARQGKGADAASQFRAAAPLYLSATDRAELAGQHA